eukprot:PITA_28436
MASSTAGHVIKCKAAVAWGAGEPLKIEEVEVAPPQAMEVRIKVHYTALCHSDLIYWEAKGQTPLFPRIFGHEAAGVVESVGEGVTDLKEGDTVLPVFTGECRACRHCNSEESNMCDLLRNNSDRGVMISDGKSRFSKDGKPIYHFLGTSTFSEYTVAHVGCVAKINPEAPLNKVCLLSCGVSTASDVGLTTQAAEGARIAGASRIIGIDLNSDRFERAKLFGVTEFLNPLDYDKPIQQVIAERTDGGVDCSIECSGNTKAEIQAFESCHDGWGVAVLVGLPNSDAVFATSPLNFLTERTLKGTFYGNYKPRSDLPGLVELYLDKKLELEKFITHEVSFANINQAFDYMIKGESLRCVINVIDD